MKAIKRYRKTIFVLILILSLNGLKAACIHPDSSSVSDKNLNKSVDFFKENYFDSLKISGSKIKLTSLTFGGTGVLFTKVNSQLGVMTGGRGSATFNNRFTFGGGGWGMPKGIVTESRSDTLEFFKLGYGGLEIGYILFEGERIRIGSNLLTACGIGFKETYPKLKGELKMFPVFEPSLYSQIALGKLMKIDIGLSYRFVTGSKFSFISNQQLSGPSIYIAFLVGTCNCN